MNERVMAKSVVRRTFCKTLVDRKGIRQKSRQLNITHLNRRSAGIGKKSSGCKAERIGHYPTGRPGRGETVLKLKRHPASISLRRDPETQPVEQSASLHS